MTRIFNFSAGPSQLPISVLEKAKLELLEYGLSGQSVMEMSHRSSVFLEIAERTEMKLRKIMEIPKNYKVLFLQGGASMQFSMIPMNLMNRYKRAGFVHTGAWTKKAVLEAKKFGECEVLATSEEASFSYIPKDISIPEHIDYCYICENNTIYGTKYKHLPSTCKVPLVSDMSSCILSEPVDVSKYGVIFAGAQKNMGIAGLCVVIIREDLIIENNELPSMLSYHVQSKHDSMFNTPPTYAIYILGLVLEWIEQEFGSLKELKNVNEKKANILYDYLDNSSLFKGTVNKKDRSWMNIPFVTGDADIDKAFIEQASENGFVNIKGHRSVGGMRASIYNAMPIEGVEKFVTFMKEFEENQR